MSNEGSYSVVIPTWNYARYITQAVDSVLAQTLPPAQVIVVDDESSDDTEQVLAPYAAVGRIEYTRHARRGIAATMNEGVRRARGAFLAFLDADDFWEPHKAAVQIEALRADPDLHMVFGMQRQFVDPAAAEPDRWRLEAGREVLPGIASNLLMIRRDAMRQVGPFAEDLVRAHFSEWFMRAQSAGLRSVVLPEVLAHRRIHGENASIRYRHLAGEYVRVAHAAARRQSRDGGGEM